MDIASNKNQSIMETLMMNQLNPSLIEESIKNLKLTEYLRDQYTRIYENMIMDQTPETFRAYWKDSDPVTIQEYLHTMAEELSDAPELYPFDHSAYIHFIAQFLMNPDYYLD